MRPTVLAFTVLAACGAPHPTEPTPKHPAPSKPHVDEGAPLVRFAFCKRTEVLEDAVERLAKAAAR